MAHAMERRDQLAAALEERGWTVVDTFGGLEADPAIGLRVDALDVAGETFENAEVTVSVRESGVSIDRVEISGEETPLTDETRALLDSVCSEKLSGPEVTVWEYGPGTESDSVPSILDDVREAYDAATARPT